MALFRVEHTRNYTVMSNHHLRNKKLSLKAKGLLSLMLSLPENWNYTLSGLAHICAEGKDAIRSAVAELEAAGYVQRARTRDKQGRLLGTEYTIREQPFFSAQPALESPALESPAQANLMQLKKEKDKIPDTPSTDSIPSSPSKPAARPGERKRKKRNSVRREEMDAYRALIREQTGYNAFVQEHPCDASRLDEMVELMVEAVCSKRETLRVAGCEFPQAVVKARLLKLDETHIRFVFDCLQENTTQVRNMKQYLLTVLFNAPVTIDSCYAAQVNHDLYGAEQTA